MPERPRRTDALGEGPHVLHVVDRDVFARFGRMLRQVFLGLGEAGIRVSLLSDDSAAIQQCSPVTLTAIYAAHLAGWQAWRLGARANLELRDDLDLLHVWGTASLPQVARWSERTGLPILVHAFGAGDVHSLAQRGVHPGQHVAGACNRLCQMLGTGRPVSQFPIRRFTPALILPDEIPAVVAKQHTLGVIWAGRIDGSAVPVVLDAMVLLRDQGQDVQLMVVGAFAPGRENGRERLWAAVRARRLNDRISILADGALWDEAMHGADACIVPAGEKELSLPPLLAMSLQKPVVASADQIAEWYVENRTAWFFSPGSAEELARLLVRASTPAAQELGITARAYVAASHSITAATAELAEFYQTVGFPQQTFQLGGSERSAR